MEFIMIANTYISIADDPRLDDKPTWYRPVYRTIKKRKGFPPDENIDLWLKHNAPLTFDQLIDIRYALYHKCTRHGFTVSERLGDTFTLTGRNGLLRIISNQARRYLLSKLRLLGREKGWIGALPRSRRPRKFT